MKISVFYDHILNASKQAGKPVEDILAATAGAGIQAVELDLYNFSDTTDHLKLLSQAGIQAACVNAHYSMDRFFDAAQAEAHVDAALRAGTNMILVVPGYLSEEEGAALGKVIHNKAATFFFLEACPAAVRIADGLAKIVEMAAAKGVTVTIEDFDNGSSPLSGLNAMLWYLEKIPGLMCTFDTGNFITHGEDLFEAWEALKDRVVHVHCKDRGEGVVSFGGGQLPCAEILRKMKADGYGSYGAIEHYGAADQLSCLLRSAGFIKGLKL